MGVFSRTFRCCKRRCLRRSDTFGDSPWEDWKWGIDAHLSNLRGRVEALERNKLEQAAQIGRLEDISLEMFVPDLAEALEPDDRVEAIE